METEVIENTKKLMSQLQEEFRKIDKEVEKKDRQIIDSENKIKDQETQYKEHFKELEKELFEKEKIEEVVRNCQIDVCEYKTAFNKIVDNYTENIDYSSEPFHFFVCFRSDYSKDGMTIRDAHEEVIKKNGFSWWGKFFSQINSQGEYEELEPFGESISRERKHEVAEYIIRNVKDRLKNGRNVYLYTYNPNPPNVVLFVSNITDIYIGYDGEVPPQNGEDKPQCAFFPKYYFVEDKRQNCSQCNDRNKNNCQLEYKSNFFFKIDKVQKLGSWEDHGSIRAEFNNLKSIYTKDRVNLAVPIFYPLLVYQDKENAHFLDNVKLIPGNWDGNFTPIKGEGGHTRTQKVSTFFSRLNKECKYSFNNVLQLPLCNPQKGAKPKVNPTKKNDEIEIYLPAEYRQEGAGSVFKILLNEETSLDQKRKIIEIINNYFKEQYC